MRMVFTQGADLKEYPDKKTLVYLADTFGESGTMISLANMVILGDAYTSWRSQYYRTSTTSKVYNCW